MTERSFAWHLVSVWVAYFAANLWWRIAHPLFIVPAYARWDREGKAWPEFAQYTVTVAFEWEANHHVWKIAGFAVSLALLVSLHSSTAQAAIGRVARLSTYAYLAALVAVSVCVAIVSSW